MDITDKDYKVPEGCKRLYFQYQITSDYFDNYIEMYDYQVVEMTKVVEYATYRENITAIVCKSEARIIKEQMGFTYPDRR